LKPGAGRSLQVGAKVLVLLPTDANKMLLGWKGPFVVLKKIGKCDYLIEMSDGVQ
jgi:hypothetical protein